MAALIRRLGNFTKSFHSTTRPRHFWTFKSSSTELSTQESELQSVVQEFKKSCEDKQFRRQRFHYTRHVRRLANANQFDMIEDVLEHQKKYPDIRREGFTVRLISLYGESGMFEHARKLFDQLPALGCPRTVMSFTALLKSALAAKEFHKVIELFNDLPSKISVEPNVISHNTVVHALCEIGSVDEALSKLREMDKTADVITYNTLLSALYKCDRFSDAEKLWAEMEESKAEVRPNTRSYNMRIRNMISKKKVDEAVLLATEMANKGIEYNNFTYSDLIVGLCRDGNLELAKKWYDDLQKSKCVAHFASIYSTLIPVCCEAGDFDKAFQICLDADKRKIFLASTISKQVIDGLTENGKTEKASELMKLLKRSEE